MLTSNVNLVHLTSRAARSAVWAVAGLLLFARANGQPVLRIPGDVSGLSQAIASVPDGGVIELAAGTYFAPSGGFAISDQAKRFTVRAAAGAGVVLDGAGAHDILRFINSSFSSGRQVSFENLTFANGLSSLSGIAAGVTLQFAQATFTSCVFQNNALSSPNTGGGAVGMANSVAFFFDCVWTGNSARFSGGALAVETSSRAYVHRGTFTANRTNLPNHINVAAGGAIHVGNSVLRVSNSRFDSNQAGYVGGAIYAIGSWADPLGTPASDVLVSDCTFINNQAVRDPSVSFSPPTEGGAFHAEDQTTARIFNSRFVTNRAETGGGINLYRAIVEIRGCVLQGNQAVGAGSSTGFGGAVSAVSGDGNDATTGSGTINRRTATVVISDTFIQGRFGGVTTVGQTGGGLYVSGDANRLYGLSGVPQNGTVASNRASAQLTNVLIVDCDVQEVSGVGGTGVGGGLAVDLTDLAVTNSLVANCDAFAGSNPGNASGGGLAILGQSLANIVGTTVARSTAGRFGGGVFAQGSTSNISSCAFIANEVSPGFSETVSQSFGAALFTAPADGIGVKADGVVANCIFTENVGLPIFDDDRQPAPINDVRYNGNQVFSTTFGATVYSDALAQQKTVATWNSLTVARSGGVSTPKSQVANTSLATRPAFRTLVAAPTVLLAAGAVGDAAAPAAYLGYAWSGASASLDGAALAAVAGVTPVSNAGTHTLTVDGASSFLNLPGVAAPAVSLSASPSAVPASASTTLSWSASSGSFLDAALDQGAAAPGAASGSASVAVPATAVFSLYEIFQEGGAAASAVVTATGTPASVTSISASPVLVDPGSGSFLSWSTSNATSVLVNGAPVAGSGSAGVVPSVTTVYTVEALNSFGTDTRRVTVTVNSGTAALASPSIVNPVAGGTYNTAGITFSWNSVGGAAGYDLRLFDAGTGNVLFSGSIAGAGSTSTLISLSNGSYVFAARSCSAGGFSDAFCGRFSTRGFAIALTAPAASPVISAPAQGASLASSVQTFSWSAVAKSDPAQSLFYEVLLLDVAASATELQITVADPQLSTIYSLHSSTSYELKVRACQAGCGPYSAPVTFSVNLPAVPSAAPAITASTISGGNSLTVSWTAVPRADSYRLLVVQPGGGPGGGALTVAARQVTGTTATLGVPAGTANVIVAGCNGDGCGPFSAAVPVNPAGPNPAAPVVGNPIAGTVFSGPTVSFAWSRVPGDNGSNTIYRLFVQDLSRQAAALDVYTTSNFWGAALKAEGSRYDVLVIANPGPSQVPGPASGFNLRGVSASSPTMVAPGHQSSVPSGNIQLSWSPVPNATLYEYFVAVQGQPNATAIGVTPGLLVQVPLSGAPTTYSAIARACPAGNSCSITSDAGWGPWSNAPGGPGVTNFTVTP